MQNKRSLKLSLDYSAARIHKRWLISALVYITYVHICFVVNNKYVHGTKWLMRSSAINDSLMTSKRHDGRETISLLWDQSGVIRRYVVYITFSSNEVYKSYKCLLPPSHHGRNLQLLVARQWNHDYWFTSRVTDTRIVKLIGYVQWIAFPINYSIFSSFHLTNKIYSP